MLIPYKSILDKYNIRPTGVLHIGANTGQEADDYYNNGVQRTIWIEADSSLIPKLIANLQPYPEHLIFNDCLTDVDGEEIQFHIANNDGQSSSILELGTHATVHPEVHYVNHTMLHSKRLDTLMTMNQLEIADYPFINVDVQGAELLVLKGMGELLHKVHYIYLEVNDNSLYQNCALYPEIKQYLSTFGFTMKEKVMCGNTGWGDAYFSR